MVGVLIGLLIGEMLFIVVLVAWITRKVPWIF